jgi:hypothetical protein
MRFMVMIKASPDTEMGVEPEEELLLAMGKYNEELVKAGVMLDGGAGLMPSSRGARVEVRDGTPLVTDGPFTEIKEVIAGFWIWNCASLEEAIGWVARCPIAHGQDRFEIRQLYELEDFATQGEGYEQHKKVEAELARRNAGA